MVEIGGDFLNAEDAKVSQRTQKGKNTSVRLSGFTFEFSWMFFCELCVTSATSAFKNPRSLLQ